MLFSANANASDITYANKSTGDTFTAANANEIKTAVNSKADDSDLTSHTNAAAPHSGHVDTTGDETIAGVKTFTSIPVGPASDPTTDNQLARKAYVDSVASGGASYVEDDAYGAGWDSDTTHAPSQNTVYDAIEGLSSTYEPIDATILKYADVDDSPVDSATAAPISSNWAYDHVDASDPHTGYVLESNVEGTASNGSSNPIDSDWAYDHENASDPHSGYVLESNVDDTPADSATTDPISSNWAYDHVAAADPHTGYVLESDIGSTVLAPNGDGSGLSGIQVIESAEYDCGTESTSEAVDFDNGRYQKITLGGNITTTLSATDIGHYQIKLVQDATGSRTVTWGTTVNWKGGTAPVLTVTAYATDFISLYYDGTDWWGQF